jgi:hypothetical protein
MRAVPAVVRSGVDPNILEYVDKLTLAAISYAQNLNLGIPDNIREAAEAHVVIGVESPARPTHRPPHLQRPFRGFTGRPNQSVALFGAQQ